MAKGHKGGGGGCSKPPQHRQTRRPAPTPQPKEAAAEPATAGPDTGSAPAEPATGSAKHAWVPKVFGSPPSLANSKGNWEPLGVSPEDIHVTMGVQHIKGCCVLHVCMLTLWEGCLILKVQTSKNSSKNFFEAILLVFERFLQRLKKVTNTTTPKKNPRASINNHKSCHNNTSHNWSKAL